MPKQSQTKLVTLLSSLVLSHCAYATSYEQGSISIQPLMIGLGNFSLGMRTPDSRINGLGLNAFRAANGFGVSEVDKFAIGYSAEIAYFICDNFSLDFRISYIEDKALTTPIAVQGFSVVSPVLDFEFNSRTNWGYSIGFNRFFEVKDSKWLPFAGIMAGYIYQDNTRAVVSLNTTANSRILGDAELQPRLARFKLGLNVGADYQFNQRWAVSIATGLSYLERPAASYETIFGFPIAYQENLRSFTIPFYVSVRNVIPSHKKLPPPDCSADTNPAETTETKAADETSATPTETKAAETTKAPDAAAPKETKDPETKAPEASAPAESKAGNETKTPEASAAPAESKADDETKTPEASAVPVAETKLAENTLTEPTEAKPAETSPTGETKASESTETKPAETSPTEETKASESTDKPAESSQPEDAKEPQASTSQGTTYLIQAGSFRKANSAEELKRKLLLNDFEASIKKSKIMDNQPYYCVYVGPFNSKEQALMHQHRLEQQKILDSIVLKQTS